LIRDYFRNDVIPGLERQQPNFVIIDTNWPQLIIFAPLLCALGVAVFVYGFFIRSLTRKQLRRQRDPHNPLGIPPAPWGYRRPRRLRSRPVRRGDRRGVQRDRHR
jgi:hypothetical protein